MKIENIIKEEYSESESSEVKKINYSSSVSDLISLFEEKYEKLRHTIIEEISLRIEEIFETEKSISYHQEDISLFSQTVQQESFDHIVLGSFLTELVQFHYKKNQTKEPYVVFSDDSKGTFSSFGFKLNGPHIKLFGNSGDSLCRKMISGKIEVYGNVGNICGGFMEGGEIAIFGNTGRLLGYRMKEGIIRARSAPKGLVGFEMENGEIIIEEDALSIGSRGTGGIIRIGGNCETIGSPTKTTIYVKGEIIK